MKCEECTLRLWCVGVPELKQEDGCNIEDEIAYLILSYHMMGSLKEYCHETEGFNYSPTTRQAIVAKFENYVYWMDQQIYKLLSDVVKTNIIEDNID